MIFFVVEPIDLDTFVVELREYFKSREPVEVPAPQAAPLDSRTAANDDAKSE